MDPFFILLEKQRQSNKDPSVEVNRIVSLLKDRIGDCPRGTATVSSRNLDPIVQAEVRAKVGEVQITQTLFHAADQPVVVYEVSW